MAITLTASEQSLGIFNPPTKPVICQVDFSPLAAGDVCTIRCYVKTNGSGNTKKILYSQSFSGPQDAFTWQSVPVENDYYIEFMALQTTGSGKTVDYFVQEVTV
jgi:hypothetical protein